MSEDVTSDPVTKTGTRFPCKECGAMLLFAPGTNALTCVYCGTANEIAASTESVEELDYHAQLAALEKTAETVERRVLKCDSCAAEVEPPPNITATDCPYCGFHLNITLQTSKGLKPKSLLPFKITRDEAQGKFFDWLKGRWFAPNRLKNFARSESKLNGMYVPYWTYDSATTSRYTGQRGDAYYVTVGTGKNQRRERRIRWRDASGTVHVDFDDVLVLASHGLPQELATSLEPWDLKGVVPYDDAYLSGFQSECYHINLEQGFDVAKGIMEAGIHSAIRSDIGGDEQRIITVRTDYGSLKFKHILLPLWISAYRFHDKVYRFLVNARTGEVQGERPYSWVKITLAALAALLVVGVIVLVVSRN